ncbi:lytic transglycosylase domain-containing protein [Actinoplanes sp. M2I2]|uniref:lytic transglycosylase domain-containing protein n=1 Tax=Actinoplanes sp. M2I2 TaxID=1734444 RepID=UPI00202264D9|nr:lytic transglycosylase domain-containing protein [Actinoplanes sp. M2I2]
MNRLWSRVGVRVASVSLLVAGAATGIYLGQDREVQQRSAEASVVAQVAVDNSQLLKQRQSEHAAARAFQREATVDAAAEAATTAKAAATKAHQAEQKVIAQKKAAAEAAAKKAQEEKAKEKEEEADSESGSSSDSSPAYTGDIPASCSEYSGNRAIGCSMMLDAGFKISQFPCLEKLWDKESGWNKKATNPSSGAYGIPQALPGSKMKSAGSDWKTNPATQIEWGLGYIEGRYNTPCSAWGHSQDVGWY